MRHRRPDIRNLQQLLDAGVEHAIELSEVLGQIACRRFTDVANAKSVEKALQRRALALAQRIDQVAGALVAHAIERGERGDAELVHVGQCADSAAVDQLVDQLVAKAFDVEGAALREVQDRLLALRRAKQAAAAAPVDLAFFARDRTAADRATARSVFCSGRTAIAALAGRRLDDDSHHLRDHIAGSAHDRRYRRCARPCVAFRLRCAASRC